MSRVDEIIKAEAEAGRLQGESDQWRWLAAELIAGEIYDGKSQRQLAREIGKSHQHVSRMVQCWHLKVTKPSEALGFNEVYNSPAVRRRKLTADDKAYFKCDGCGVTLAFPERFASDPFTQFRCPECETLSFPGTRGYCLKRYRTAARAVRILERISYYELEYGTEPSDIEALIRRLRDVADDLEACSRRSLEKAGVKKDNDD